MYSLDLCIDFSLYLFTSKYVSCGFGCKICFQAGMFQSATSFNVNISGWDVSSGRSFVSIRLSCIQNISQTKH